ncbi:hypothetical protein ACFUMH_05210 [Cellulomonas sp. NPDC057328]|uniref:hypothetical protein n=1 Tax=Cellulomonas sp. NPDC057328 TaxID=3346101 RepID=UPI0036272E7F
MDDTRDPRRDDADPRRHDADARRDDADPRRDEADDPTTADPAGAVAADAAAEDAAVARVRAADPAAGTTPDLPRLQARLADATGVPTGTSAAGTAAVGTAAAVPDELAAAREERRRRPARWLQVAAVATGALVLGGGGYALGAAGADQPAAPPIALQGGAATESTVGGAAPAAADTARSMIAPGFGGRTTFAGEGLPTEAGQARAFAFDATSAATAEAARRAAEVLGVAGEPRGEWGQWVVGTTDGSAASVTVGGDGMANLWFYDPARDPSACRSGLPETPDVGTDAGTDGGAGVDGSSAGTPEPAAPDVSILPAPRPAPADPSVCDPGATPTGDAAVAAARDLVGRLGVDTAGYEFAVAEDTGVPGLVQVQGTQVVDGTQTGVAWSVGLAGDGVQSVSGPLASLVELGTYDVVGAADAVDRLNDPRFGASFGGVMPFARAAGAAEGAVADDAVGIMPVEPEPEPAPAEPTVPPVPAPGSPIAWPVQEVTLVDARLGVTLLTAPDGATLLVPAWELTDADGRTWSVVAVAEDQLDLSPAG